LGVGPTLNAGLITNLGVHRQDFAESGGEKAPTRTIKAYVAFL